MWRKETNLYANENWERELARDRSAAVKALSECARVGRSLFAVSKQTATLNFTVPIVSSNLGVGNLQEALTAALSMHGVLSLHRAPSNAPSL